MQVQHLSIKGNHNTVCGTKGRNRIATTGVEKNISKTHTKEDISVVKNV